MSPIELHVTDALKVVPNQLAVRLTSTTVGKPKMREPVQLKIRTRTTVE